jgi:hypothetical protein
MDGDSRPEGELSPLLDRNVSGFLAKAPVSLQLSERLYSLHGLCHFQ